MKTQATTHGNRALTLTEVLVVIGVIVVAAMLWTLAIAGFKAAKSKARQMVCVDNLRVIYFAEKKWADENENKFPMQIALTNEVTMQLISHGDVYLLWQTISNEAYTPKNFRCPNDTNHIAATNFVDFSDANISYFLNLDANQRDPQMFLTGDDNFAINGQPVQPGILNFPTSATIEWTDERHHRVGNIALTDGSAQQTTTSTLQQTFQLTGAATNRLVIP